MPNVFFKRGSQTALNALINGSGDRFVDGSFYLTTDTDRLYVAQSASELVELNKSIHIVPTIDDLPKTNVDVGQFYYVQGSSTSTRAENVQNGNILAVVTGYKGNGDPNWVQVNPDTNTNDTDNDHVTGFSITKSASSTQSVLRYDWKIEQENVNNNAIADLTGSFEILSSDIAQLAGASVGLASTAPTNNTVTLSTTGSGAGVGSLTFAGKSGGNITISGSANSVIIDSKNTEYIQSVNSGSKTITLENTDGVSNDIGSTVYNAGTAIDVTVAASGTGNKNATITIAHASVTRSADTTSSATFAFGGSTTVVTGITTNDQGHVTNVATKTITLPQETAHAVDSISADNTGHLTVSFDGVATTSTSADLFYTVNGVTVYNQGSIDFYTKNEIDTMFNGIDAMSYKGNVPGTGLPTSGVHNGDTYTVTADGTYGGQSAKVGDLLIASGTEYTTEDEASNSSHIAGTLPTNGITWNLVPSGNDFNTEYDLTVANNTISLEDNISGSTPDEVTFAAGNKLAVSTSGTTITYSHTTATVTGGTTANLGNQNLTYGNTVSVVNGIKVDNSGHIDSIYTSTLTMPAAPADTKESFAVTASTSTAHGNGIVVLTEDNGGNDKGQIKFINGQYITAIVAQDGSTTKATVQINHNQIATTATNNTSSPTTIDESNGVNVITGITDDTYGHITGYTVSKIKLPEIALTKLGGGADANDSAVAQVTANTKAKVAFLLSTDSGNDFNRTGIQTPEFTMSTSSLKIAATAATSSVPGNIAIDIEWGSF